MNIQHIRDVVESGEEIDWEDASNYLKTLLSIIDDQSTDLKIAQAKRWLFPDPVPTQGRGDGKGHMFYGDEKSLKELDRLVWSDDRLKWFEDQHRVANIVITKNDKEINHLTSEVDRLCGDLIKSDEKIEYLKDEIETLKRHHDIA